MEAIAEEDWDKMTCDERLKRMKCLYQETLEGDETSETSASSNQDKWLSYTKNRRGAFTKRTVSETSMYRSSSKYSVKSASTGTKTLDFLMQCFWNCSPGCQQIS